MALEKSFETAISELQEVVKQLESGNLGLEDSLNAYKKGVELSKYCKKKLAEAKESVVTIMNEDSEQPFTEEK